MNHEDQGVAPIAVFDAVVLDASVLYPIALRDLLLRLAEYGLYLPRWSPLILEELRRSLVADARSDEARARRLLSEMRRHFLGAEIDPSPELIERMTNAIEDRHVLAVAVEAEADIIVTGDLKHFPPSALARWGVEARSPDAFLQELLDAAPETVVQALREQASALVNPPKTLDQVLSAVATQAPLFVASVRVRLAVEDL